MDLEKLDIVIGRENVSATIFVPYDCKNRCNFCTTKQFYKDILPFNETIVKIEKEIKRFCALGLTIFTLTGGEPLANLNRCKIIIELIKKHCLFPDELTIYLNTSLPKGEGVNNIINFLNDPTNHIDGISVSRHRNTFEKDSKLLRNVFEDELIAKIKPSVRINCLVTPAIDVDLFVKRWSPYPNIKINFRANYMRINQDNLHEEDQFFNQLSERFKFIQHTECNVCNTDSFVNEETNQLISYHKGIFTTAIVNDTELEINDFVIDMFGDSYFDWLFNEEHKVTDQLIDKINEKYI